MSKADFTQFSLISDAKQDWLNSGISDDVIDLNLKAIDGHVAIDKFISNCELDKKDRLNTGAINSAVTKRYDHLGGGYWYVNSFNPITKELDFAQCKPFNPKRIGFGEKAKTIKYETPKGKPTPFVFLNIPMRIINHLAKKHKIELLPIDAVEDKWQWIKDHPQIPVAITEGVKKAAALISVGIIAIASSSITTHSEKATEEISSWFTELKPELKWLLETGKREIFITFDRSDIKLTSKLAVNKQTKTLGKKILKYGHSVKIVLWNDENSKGIDDYLVNHGVKKLRKLFTESQNYSKFVARLRALGTRKLSNSIKFSKQHFPNDFITLAKESNKKIIGIKSQQNTGKTTAIAKYLKTLPAGTKILNITHRKTLSRNLAERLGINCYLDDDFIKLKTQLKGEKEKLRMKIEDKKYYIAMITDKYSISEETENVMMSEEEKTAFKLAKKDLDSMEKKIQTMIDDDYSLSICADSLMKLSDTNTYDVIILDEIEQIIFHLLSANTEIKKNRGDIIKQFIQLLENCVNNGGLIICADADLSDYSIKFLTGNLNLNSKDVVCYDNDFKPFSDRSMILFSSEIELRKEVLKAIENNERIIISTSGQKVNSSSGTINLEQWLLDYIPESDIYRIDQETVSEIGRKELGITDNLSKLKEAKVIIHSNTISTGVSLDVDIVGKFDKVFGIFWGNYALDDFMQSLERYRGDCDRFVFLPESRKALFGNGSASQDKLIRHFDNKLTQSGYIIDLDNFIFCNSLIANYSMFASRINGDLQGLKSNFIVHAENKGYSIIRYSEKLEKEEAKAIKIQKKDIKDKSCKNYAKDLYKTPLSDITELEKIKQKQRKTKEERLKEKRGNLNKRYGELAPSLLSNLDLFTQFVIADLGQLYPQLRKRFFCKLGSNATLLLDKEKAYKKQQYLKENNSTGYFLEPINLTKNSIHSKMIELLGISIEDLEEKATAIADQELEELENILQAFGRNSQEYLTAQSKIKEKAFCTDDVKQWSKDIDLLIEKYGTAIETAFDIDLSKTKHKEDKAMVRYGMILSRLGYKLECCFRSWEDDQQVRYYRIVDCVPRDVWQQIESQWFTEICQSDFNYDLVA